MKYRLARATGGSCFPCKRRVHEDTRAISRGVCRMICGYSGISTRLLMGSSTYIFYSFSSCHLQEETPDCFSKAQDHKADDKTSSLMCFHLREHFSNPLRPFKVDKLHFWTMLSLHYQQRDIINSPSWVPTSSVAREHLF